MFHRVLYSLCLAVTFSLATAPAVASERDHDRARAALKAGEVLPLATVLQRVAQTYPGEILEVELEREDGRWIYELKLLQRGGALVKLHVDARTAEVLKRKDRR
ncbi:PepSY domain-containing protein [Caenimonas sp. SL110]|uniref:PepSY domain-containing protein n=1 Tax=Caenimonas sp. SL110 TaxID=1450524 RepID=UPI001EE72422|nr:PepSY domain-containing protein [Caenimonas sp. SL110]